MPIPQDSSVKRQINGWEFHYNDWDGGAGTHTTPVDDAKTFPPECKRFLDRDVLRKLGLTKHRMVVQDALFFYQLLIPICDVNNSGIVDDPRYNYLIYVETFPARYTFNTGLLGSYDHNFKVPTIAELVKFDGVVIRDGVRGGIDGAL